MATVEASRRPGDLDARERAAAFRDAESGRFDVVVIGGGITGAGIARSAAARGLRVVLLEARDLASGTSSRSSKMIHGGVRYLAQGDVALVRQAATERQVLRRIAPHLARLTPFVLPTRSASGMARFRAGMWAYEKLGQVPVAERHEVWSAAELDRREPLAAVEGTTGAVLYYEFLTDDARLTLANARSAAAEEALVLTYAPVTAVELEGGRAVGVRCVGALPGEQREAIVRGRVVVNAAGPWVDAIRALEAGRDVPRLALTKGIHLVVPHARLPIERTVLMAAADKRPVFAVPRGDVTYLGTTDTFHAEPGYWPRIERADVDYLLEAAARSFATDPLVPSDAVTAWSGVRPLIAQEGRKPSEISRRDAVWTGPGGVVSVAGGKLTAYRAMAEQVVDGLVERLGVALPAAETDRRPLVGGDVETGVADARSIRPEGDAPDRLVSLYGSEAADVRRDGGSVAAEVRQAVRREGALRLEDWWVRRSGRAFFSRDAGLADLEAASREMAGLLGWSETVRADEVAECRRRQHESLAALRDAEATPDAASSAAGETR